MIPPKYDLRATPASGLHLIFALHHGYGGIGNACTYSFAVFEEHGAVAAFVWQPPAPGAAKSVCPEIPQGVLSLSRMVAVPRIERQLNHISKPLRRQMRVLIDRTRWPVLVTYSDEGQGHTGHVYKCSGWEKTTRKKYPYFEDEDGVRRSSYSNGKAATGLRRAGTTWIQRWEHWICPQGHAAEYMQDFGWRREPIPGKVWRSGNQAYRWVQEAA